MGVMARDEGAGKLTRLARRMSKRVSLAAGAVAVAAGATTGSASAAAASRKPSISASDVSDVEETQGAGLQESNAINDEGLRILSSVATELEHRLAEESRVNEDDPFSMGAAPHVAIVDYLSRLTRYVNVWRGHAGGKESAGVRSAVMAVIYLERLESRHGFTVNSQNVHRLLMTSVLVATKFLEDRPLSTEFWSRVAGVSLKEVNTLESKFCALLDFELFVDEAEYDEHLQQFNMPEF